ncbi:MAG: oligosaccharide flippase family protein [Anaerolineales bacterium]|nr:oligosaccharide flippase family protein [Anaerolineales bacterium]
MPPDIYARLPKPLQRLFDNALIRRIAKNTGYLFSAHGISAALSMLQGILTARLLGVANYGVLGAIITFTSSVNKLASFRMSELVIKYVGHYTEHKDPQRAAAIFKAAALTEMVASGLAFALIWLLAPIGAKYFAKDLSTTDLFVVYGLIVIANLIAESSTGLLQIFDRFRRMAFLDVIQSLFTLVMISITYFSQGGLYEILLAYLGGKVIGASGMTIAALVEASRRWGLGWWRAPLNLLRPQWRELAHFAISTNISASLSLINKDSELLWVSFFRSPTETGYYKLALSLANLVQMPVTPLPQATYPELSRQAAHKNWDSVRQALRQGSLLAGGYSLVAMLGLALLGIPLIRFFYTAEFLPAYPALLILLLGFLAANTFYWRRVALLALGRADFPAKLNLILATLKVAGILLLVPRFGYLANAALLAAFYWVGSLISAWKVHTLIASRVEASPGSLPPASGGTEE